MNRLFLSAVACILAAAYAPCSADLPDREVPRTESGSFPALSSKPRSTAWVLKMDNDAFVGSGTDQDYTGGASLTLGPGQVPAKRHVLDPALNWLDEFSGFDKRFSQKSIFQSQRSVQMGLNLFTPESKSSGSPIPDDRPYANLVYVASSRYAPSSDTRHFYQSSLTLGLLGTRIGEALQDAVHGLTGSTKSRGFDHQVSDGGELTGRYAVSRHTLLRADEFYDLKLSIAGSVGYLTEGSVGLSFRLGRNRSPWWLSMADYGHFADQPVPIAGPGPGLARSGERYWSVGFRARIRAYNAFLQGQFRDSPITHSSGELNAFLFDAWLGFSTDIGQFALDYAVHFQTSEIARGPAARDLVWATVTLARKSR